jgi:hypothetical protein
MDEEYRDELFILLDRLKSPDFTSHVDPHVQIKVACHLGKMLEVLPFKSFAWHDEDLVVSCFIIWLYSSADFLGH